LKKKIIFIFILITLKSVLANKIINNNSMQDKGCKIPFFKKNNHPCPSNTPIPIPEIEKKKNIVDDKLKNKLSNILVNIKKYKKNTTEEKERLKAELKMLKEQFDIYKSQKTQEVKILKKKLTSSEKNLKKIKNKLKTTKNKKKTVIKEKIIVKEKKKEEEKTVLQAQEIQTIPPSPYISPKENIENTTINLPSTNNLPWIIVTIEHNIDIYQLALRYYGEKEKYLDIYAANQDVIGMDFKLSNGMKLKIPIINQFEEQPIILNNY